MNRSLFSKTPSLEVFDSRGLCIRNVAYHRHPDVAHETTAQVTHHGFNPQGFPVRSADPRLHDSGVENFAWITSLSGKALCVFSVDAGVTVTLHDAAGRPRQRTTQLRAIEASVPGQSEAVTCTWQYETSALPGRPLLIVESGPNGEERVLERFVYAGSSPAEQALNLAGQCVFHHDPAGLLRTDCVALTGVPLSVTRCLTEGTSDLNADAGFTTRTLADATCLAISVTDAKGNQRHFRYDRVGQLAGSSLTMAGAARQTIIESLDYSAAGEKLSETHGNGLVTRYEYEPPTRRLTRIVTGRPAGHPLGSRVLLDLRYEYDPVGNVVRMSNEADKVRFWRNQKVEPVDTYVYDSLYQLIGATGREMANAGRDDGRWATRAASDDVTWTRYSRSYSYDRGGNLTCIRHSAPASGNNHTIGITVSDRSNRGVLADLADQPAQVDGLFTPGGQQAWLQPGQALRWTGRGELHEVVPVARAGAPDDAEYYRYDGNRQRVLKVSVRQSASVTQVHRVVYLPALELRHSTRGDVQVENFQVVTLGGAGCAQVRLLRWEAGKPDGVENDQLRYSYDNLQGSTSLEVDGHGRVVSQECYFPYGGTSLLIAGSSVEADYRTIRYSGKERDATGLYYYGYRYYQALAGRWLSADPGGDVDGLNLFGFCHGNPLSLVDRSGAVGEPVNRNPDVSHSYWTVTWQDIAQDWAGFYRSQGVTPQMFRGNASSVVVNQTKAVMLSLDPELYNARFQPAEQHLNEQSLNERASIGRIYRLDWSSPGEVLNRGFRASSDFSAVENMLRGEIAYEDGNESDHSVGSSSDMTDEERRRAQETLIVSTEITGVDYYTRVTQARGYLYEIDATNIAGVSLTDNLINNPQGLVRFFDSDHAQPVSRDGAYQFLSNFGIDIELEEAHVDVSELNKAIRSNPGRVRFIHRYG